MFTALIFWLCSRFGRKRNKNKDVDSVEVTEIMVVDVKPRKRRSKREKRKSRKQVNELNDSCSVSSSVNCTDVHRDENLFRSGRFPVSYSEKAKERFVSACDGFLNDVSDDSMSLSNRGVITCPVTNFNDHPDLVNDFESGRRWGLQINSKYRRTHSAYDTYQWRDERGMLFNDYSFSGVCTHTKSGKELTDNDRAFFAGVVKSFDWLDCRGLDDVDEYDLFAK